jgi:hypothetical protein
MSSNQIMNHLEALCWVKNAPNIGACFDTNKIEFRSNNGFEDRIGVDDPDNPQQPAFILFLQQPYSKKETAIYGFIPTVLDSVAGIPTGLYPEPTLGMPGLTIWPIDRRLVEVQDPPLTPAQLLSIVTQDVYDALIVFASLPAGEDSLEFFSADVCIAVARIPQKSGATKLVPVVAPSLNPVPPGP